MGYKTLLVHVEATAESDARLGAAVDLANRWDATLVGVGGTANCQIDESTLQSTDGALIRLSSASELEDLKDAEGRFHGLVHSLSSRAKWISVANDPGAALDCFAAGADIIIASSEGSRRATTARTTDIVLGSGIPVLSLPSDCLDVKTNEIVVAWKNTAASRRAVSDALPMLKLATKVTVACACEEGARSSTRMGLREIAGRLERNGVTVESAEVKIGSGDDTCSAFIRFAEDRGFDLVVSGAYGHSRMREWVLGGFTRSLIENCDLPVMFSH